MLKRLSNRVIALAAFLTFVAQLAPAQTPAKPAIPGDAQIFNGHAYKFFPDHLTWKQAKAKCTDLGGYLVVINSAEENRFVAELVSKAGRGETWIGITDEAQEGKWVTVGGKPASFTDWYPGQPNNKPPGEHYALMAKTGSKGEPIDWRWVDQPNESKQHRPGYVCQWDQVGVGERYVLFWNFDLSDATRLPNGEILIPAPANAPYQKVRWELTDVLSSRVIDAASGRLIALRPRGKYVHMQVTIEMPIREIPKQEVPGRMPADATACLRDNAGFAKRNPLTAKLAKELKADDPARTVEKIRKWIKQNMEYQYDEKLNEKHAELNGGTDSIVKGKKGDCGGHSQLFVALCRQAGVPARILWGPCKASETPVPPKEKRSKFVMPGPLDSKYGMPANLDEVGNCCGHCWAEVYLTGWGWVPLEPQDLETPLGRVPKDYIVFLRFGPDWWTQDTQSSWALSNVGLQNYFSWLQTAGNRNDSNDKAKSPETKQPAPKKK